MATDPEAPPRSRAPSALPVGLAAAAAAIPVLLRLSGVHPTPLVAAIIFGLGVVGAAFLLAWGAELIQLDVSAGFALALLALVAVLPEYAVDFVFTWKAGKDPEKYAPDALANMTGGNQLLIGVGWSMVVLIAVWRMNKMRRARGDAPVKNECVTLSRTHTVEIAFLMIATVYGLTLPLHSTLTLFDSAVLVSIFVWYIVRVARAPAEEPHLVGPAAAMATLPPTKRRIVVGLLFTGSIIAILACAEPFAESLIDVGHDFNIDDFVLISLVAPLASEAPELLVAGLFAWRMQAETGLGALVSSKVNQWTLLVGTLPIVFAISSSSLHGLPIDAVQREELFVTAAQSAYAVAILSNRNISAREAWTLLTLFLVQLVTKFPFFEPIHTEARITVGCVYLGLAAIVLFQHRVTLKPLVRDGLRAPYAELTD